MGYKVYGKSLTAVRFCCESKTALKNSLSSQNMGQWAKSCVITRRNFYSFFFSANIY